MFRFNKRQNSRWAKSTATLLVVLLFACTVETRPGPKGEPALLLTPPPGAIKVEEDLYMVEIGKDESGCRQYSAWSSKRAVVAAVFYGGADGNFTLLRSEAKCDKR